jgi:SAM-dependent methyltransferase
MVSPGTTGAPKLLGRDDLLRTQRFFNRPCPSVQGERSPVERHIFEAIAALIPQGAGAGIAVDLGCHWGRYTRALAETYLRVVGVDTAAEAVRTAPRLPNVEYRTLDVEEGQAELDFGGPVSFFLAVGLFEMLAAPDELSRRLCRTAAPQGRILVVIPNRRSLHYAAFRTGLWLARTIEGRSTVFISNNGASRRAVGEWLHAAGFALRGSGAIVGVPPAILALLPSPLQSALLKLDGLALRLLGGSYHWVLAERGAT